MTFDQLYIPVDGDETDVWAAMHEFELRQRRYRLAKLGLVGVLGEVRDAIERLNAKFSGLRP